MGALPTKGRTCHCPAEAVRVQPSAWYVSRFPIPYLNPFQVSHLPRPLSFSVPHPEFQFAPLPQRNPVLFGERWKQYHEALGPSTACIPDFSWEMVKKEKAPDMRHLLQFPCNGEAPFDKLMMSDVTPNEVSR